MFNWIGLIEQLNRGFTGLAINSASQNASPKPKLAQGSLRNLDVRELFAAILQPHSRAKAIVELGQRCTSQPVLAHGIYLRPAILPAILLEVMKHSMSKAGQRSIQNTCDLINAVTRIYGIIFKDQGVRNRFLANGALFYLIPFLGYNIPRVEPNPSEADLNNIKNMRKHLLELFIFLVQTLAVDEIDELLIGPTTPHPESGATETIHLKQLNLYDEAVNLVVFIALDVDRDVPLLLLKLLLACPGVLGLLGRDPHRFELLLRALFGCLAAVVQKLTSNVQREVGGTAGCVQTDPSLKAKLKPTVLHAVDCFGHIGEIEPLRTALCTVLPTSLPHSKIMSVYVHDTEVVVGMSVMLKKLGLSVKR